MFEIFGFPQVLAICLLSMFLLPLVFYLASKPGSKRTGFFSNHAQKSEKPLKVAPVKKRKGKSALQKKTAIDANGKAEKDENLTINDEDEADEVKEGKRGKKSRKAEELEPRHED